MKKIAFLAVAAVILTVTAALMCASDLRHKAVRHQLQLTYSAVLTAEDYHENAAFGQADLAARDHLASLESENLDPKEAGAASAMRAWLGTVESLVNSITPETATLRAEIADKAAESARKAMLPFMEPSAEAPQK